MVAPAPVLTPAHRPAFKVRLMHSRPIGPMGAEIDNPSAIPEIVIDTGFIRYCSSGDLIKHCALSIRIRE